MGCTFTRDVRQAHLRLHGLLEEGNLPEVAAALAPCLDVEIRNDEISHYLTSIFDDPALRDPNLQRSIWGFLARRYPEYRNDFKKTLLAFGWTLG